MKYILKEIDSEEEFIEVFGARLGWILSPEKLSDQHYGSKTEGDQSEQDDANESTD